VLRVVSLDQGTASSPITITQDSQAGQVALDLARGRAVAVSAATVGVSPTLWLTDLAGTRPPISRTIAGPVAPQRYIGGIAVDPATGDALVAATGESLMGIAAQLLRVAPSGRYAGRIRSGIPPRRSISTPSTTSPSSPRRRPQRPAGPRR